MQDTALLVLLVLLVLNNLWMTVRWQKIKKHTSCEICLSQATVSQAPMLVTYILSHLSFFYLLAPLRSLKIQTFQVNFMVWHHVFLNFDDFFSSSMDGKKCQGSWCHNLVFCGKYSISRLISVRSVLIARWGFLR